jgi:tetratricopeptide (TPR) repeat protein
MISIHYLGWMPSESKRYDEAVPLLERAGELIRKKHGEDHPETVDSMSQLALAYARSGRTESGISLARKAVELSMRTFEEDAPCTLACLENLGLALYCGGHMEEAVAFS